MIRFLADENFNNNVVQAVRRRSTAVQIERVQDVGLYQADDPTVLEYAATHSLAVLTHDVRTMPDYATARIDAGLPMPGLFVVPSGAPRQEVIEDIAMIAECSLTNEWDGQIVYLPLR